MSGICKKFISIYLTGLSLILAISCDGRISTRPPQRMVYISSGSDNPFLVSEIYPIYIPCDVVESNCGMTLTNCLGRENMTYLCVHNVIIQEPSR